MIVKGLGRDRSGEKDAAAQRPHFRASDPSGGGSAYSESCPPQPGFLDETIEFEVVKVEARDDPDDLAVVDGVISFRAGGAPSRITSRR